MKTIYAVRHCRASGQAPDAPLTAEGVVQAAALADFLAPLGIERIVVSPYLRAQQSIAPLAARLGLVVEQDARLVERVLSTGERADWLERLRESFEDWRRLTNPDVFRVVFSGDDAPEVARVWPG